MSMLNCFFSNKYADRSDLFDGLDIWNEEAYRKIQGTYPVIFVSFASVKADNAADAKKQIKLRIAGLYEDYAYLLQNEKLSELEKMAYRQVLAERVDMDEYDTPMQESYVYGYWEELTTFMRNLFNATFKTNSSLERALMTGITRVSKESMFSDLNNLNVVSTTSDQYTEAFGFTEQEVFGALEKYRLSDKKELKPYLASTSSNGLVDKLLQTGSAEMKTRMETLLDGGNITVNIDEQMVFDQLEQNEDAVWSLLLAGGYLKVENLKYEGITREPWYTLSITNLETISMFTNMFKGWFGRYDVMLIPRGSKRQGLPAVIMEFKVHNSRQEADLEATVQAALSQIEEKNYDAELLGRGFEKEQIRHYGFAFKGKEVLIG